MPVNLLETPTRIKISGDPDEIRKIYDALKYRPGNYHMADSYQIWSRHQKAIRNAVAVNDLILAEQLKARKVGWDGYKSPVSIETGSFGRAAIVLRGHLTNVLSACADHAIKVNSKELLTNPYWGISEDDIPDDLLAVPLDETQWEMQKRCVFEWLRHGIARNHVSVSGGKTAMFCAAAAMLKIRFPEARFLYFVPTERLLVQVMAESAKFLPGWHITQLGGAERDDTGKDMVVATGAILGSRFREHIANKWIKSFFALLIDECQYAASPSWSKVILSSSAYFRFGASDTVKEHDPVKQDLLTGLCGKIYGEISTDELLDLDRVATPTINVVKPESWHNRFKHLTHEPEIDTPAWVLDEGEWKSGIYKGHCFQLDKDGEFKLNRKGEKVPQPGKHLISIKGRDFEVESRWCLLERKYDKAIISFEERNELIARWVRYYSNKGWPTLVVATRTLHVLILESVISGFVDSSKVRTLFGLHSLEERNETFDWFKSTPGSVLISPLVKVGVSINQIKAGVIADYVGDWEFGRQLVGRFIRKKLEGENTCELTWFIDTQHPSYRNGGKKVIEKFKNVRGFRFNEISTDPPDCERQAQLL